MTEKTILLLNELTPAQKNYVLNRLAVKEKDLSVAYLCWFFCIHYFYLGYYRFVSNEIPCRRMQ